MFILLGPSFERNVKGYFAIILFGHTADSQLLQFNSSKFETRQGDTTIGETELLPREGFVANDAWSDAERMHQEERHRRKARSAQRPAVRALPAPPVVSQTIKQPDKFHCP